MADIVCGIDEAGRGPLLGPLVIAAVSIKKDDVKKLEKIGVKDSKLLAPAQREAMFDKILDIVLDHKIRIVQPKEIDDAVEGKDGLNLNWLEAVKEAELINDLKPDEVILDCPSTNTIAFSDYINERLKIKVNLKAEHKADVKYPVVSAASIIAKVTRDREIEKIKEKIGVDFGSGYPSDPKTQKFIKESYKKHAELFRKSWQSYKEITNSKKQAKLSSF